MVGPGVKRSVEFRTNQKGTKVLRLALVPFAEKPLLAVLLAALLGLFLFLLVLGVLAATSTALAVTHCPHLLSQY